MRVAVGANQSQTASLLAFALSLSPALFGEPECSRTDVCLDFAFCAPPTPTRLYRSLGQGNYGGKVAASFSPVQGACLVHGHGRQCLLHEGAAVTSGVKYLLRTDVMYA